MSRTYLSIMNDTDGGRIVWRNEGTAFVLSTQQAFKG